MYVFFSTFRGLKRLVLSDNNITEIASEMGECFGVTHSQVFFSTNHYERICLKVGIQISAVIA